MNYNCDEYTANFLNEEYSKIIDDPDNYEADIDIKQEMFDSLSPGEKKEIMEEQHKRRAGFNPDTKFYQNLSKGRNMERIKSDMLDHTIIESNNTARGWNNAKNGNFPGYVPYRNEKCDPNVFQMTDYKSAPSHSFGTKKSFHSLHDYLHKQ